MDNKSLLERPEGLTAQIGAKRTGLHRWTFLLGLLAIVLIAALWLAVRANAAAYTTPIRLYGQTDYNSYLSGTSATKLSWPVGVALDGNGGIYIADTQNNRVVHFPAGGTTADRVYGQPDFTTHTAGTSAISFNGPAGIAVDSTGGLYVSDHGNNRVVHFPAGSTTADRVYGQINFTTHTAGATATSLYSPWAVSVDNSGGLYIADSFNNRVLHFPAGSTNTDRVYGQINFTSNTAGTSATNLTNPWGIAPDSTGGIYVADRNNNRILHFPAGSTTADRVYGQTDFTSHNEDVSATNFNSPGGVTLDNTGGLYVADSFNNRILHFPAGDTTADQVYGQPDFTSSVGSAGKNNLSIPYQLAGDSQGGLYVADNYNSRVLYYRFAQAASLTDTYGSGQTTLVNQVFNTMLGVRVRDELNSPMNNAVITFTAPTSGAGGTFPVGMSTYTAITGGDGTASSAQFRANNIAGSYTITASVGGVVSHFWLTNLAPCTQIVVTSTLDDGSCGTLRNAIAVAEDANNNRIVTIDLPAGSIITLTNGLTLTGSTSIETTASCGAVPPIIIQGIGTESGNGILIQGNNKLSGLWIRGFSGTQLVAPTNYHATLKCVKTSKS